MLSTMRKVCWGLTVACVLLGSPSAMTKKLSLEQHMQIQTKIETDADLSKLPTIRIDSIAAIVPVNDRLDADAAFDRPFAESLKIGMTWYLKQRGVRVVASGEDLRLTGTIENYDGSKGWGHWGVDITLGFKVHEGGKVAPALSLRSLLKYGDPDTVREQEEGKYKDQEIAVDFKEVLFTRIGVDLCEKLIDALKEREASSASSSPHGSAGAERPGSISIDATVPNAEIRVDDQLVGTTPVTSLPLREGHHVIDVSKKGYKPWRRDVVILPGGGTRLVAELESESGTQ
jgi:PEGA domain